MPLARVSFSLRATSLLLGLLAACSSGITKLSEPEASDGGEDASAHVGADASIDVLPADTEKVVATAKGGMPPPPVQSDASTCRATDDTFAFVPSTRELIARSCSLVVRGDAGSGGESYAFVDVHTTLTEAEASSLLAALRSLEPSAREGCGFDKPTLTVSVTTPRGTVAYYDDFYQCRREGTYVTGMDAVFRELYELTSSASRDSGP